MAKYYVYSLIDPVLKQPFYFGKGSGNRAYAHLKGHDKFNQRKLNRIALIRECGYEPIVYKLATDLDEAAAYTLETLYIDLSKKTNWFVTNVTGIKKPPSRKGSTMSAEARQKIGDASRGKTRPPFTEEWKHNLSLAHKGKPSPRKIHISKETLENLYVVERKTVAQITEILGVSRDVIFRRLREHNITKYLKRTSCLNNTENP